MALHQDSRRVHTEELNQPQNYQQSDKTSRMSLSHQLMDITFIRQVAGDLMIYCSILRNPRRNQPNLYVWILNKRNRSVTLRDLPTDNEPH